MSKDFKYHFGKNDHKRFSFRERLLKELFIFKKEEFKHDKNNNITNVFTY